MADEPDRWWRDGVLYQIYPRSFVDTNGDGVGDLPRHHRPARPSAVARRRRHLARPDHGVAERRLGLRRRRLLRRRSRARHARRRRRAGRGGGRRAASGCCSTSCRTTRATSTRGSSTSRSSRDVAAPRLVRVGRPEARRLAAEQLGEQLRPGAGVDVRRGERPVLPEPLPARRSPTSTGGTRRCATSSTTSCASGSTAASPASASTSCHSIIKDRELRDNPPATDGRPLVRADDGPAPASTTRAGPRCTTCCGAGARSPTATTRRACSSARRTCSSPRRSRAFYGDGDELNLAFNFTFAALAVRRAAAARRRSSATEAAAARGRVAGVDGRQPRQPPLPDPVGGRTIPRRTRAALVMLLDAARHAVPLLRRRDRHARHRRARRPDPRPGRRVPRPRVRAATASARRCSGRGEPGAGFTDAGRRAVAAVRRRRRVQRRRPAPRSRLDALADAATSSACATRCPSCAPARTRRSTAPDGVLGVAARRAHRRRAATSRDEPATRSTPAPARSASRPGAPRDGERVDGALAPRAVGRRDRLARRLTRLRDRAAVGHRLPALAAAVRRGPGEEVVGAATS